MTRNKVMQMISALLILSLLTACSDQALSSTSPESENSLSQPEITLDNYLDLDYSGYDYTVGLMVPSMNSEMLVAIVDEVSAFFEERGISCQAQEAGTDADQIDCINNFTTMGMDLILAVVSNTESVQNAVENARAAGTKFFSLSAVPEYEIDGYIDMDLTTMGVIAGQMALGWVDYAMPEAGNGEVITAVLTYSSISDTADKSNAIIEVLENDPRIDIVYTKETDGIVEANDALNEVLIVHSDLDLVVTFDDGGAIGANQAWIADPDIDLNTAAIISGGYSASLDPLIESAGTTESVIRGAVLQGGSEQNYWYAVYGLQVLLGLNDSPSFVLPMEAMNSFGYVSEIE